MVGIVITVALLLAVFFFVAAMEHSSIYVQQKIHGINRKNKQRKELLINSEVARHLHDMDIKFSLYQYQIIRTLLAVLFVIFILFRAGTSNSFSSVTSVSLLIVLAIYLLSAPKSKIFGLTSPFLLIVKQMKEGRKTQYNAELYFLVSMLRNNYRVYGDRAPASVELLTEASRYMKRSKPILQKFLSYWIAGQREDGVMYFSKAIGTNEAEKLARLFDKMDQSTADVLDDELANFQDIYREQRNTERTQRDKRNSAILFTFTLAACFLVMVDLIIVGVFIEHQEAINGNPIF